jgi:nitrate/nitrite transport system ATP-binding protein
VFEDLWLSMARGEFGCVIGHSGCGKTTVLNILAGLDQPSDGAVYRRRAGDRRHQPRPRR